ncbi:putative membrane-anchored protein [Paenibacillus mucilaginosus]|uniref:GDYXXLXY domain-containing protein n=1 Tax=Paenibacillus mucilaginosus TaxID=61624 RepID=UPI003D1B40F9
MENKKHAARRGLWAILFAAAQVLVLAGIALSYYAVGWYGQDIRLRTVPVDPRDIFYGDYLTLSYEISRLDSTFWKEAAPPERGDTVYVVVKQGTDGVAVPMAVYGSKPSLAEGEAALKGIVQYAWNPDFSGEESFSVRYGIERYYVPEGTGKALEERAANLIVRVKAAPWGQVTIGEIEDVVPVPESGAGQQGS